MTGSKAQIIARLQKEIMPLQGYKPAPDNYAFDAGLGPLKHAFPNGNFPLGAVHEFFCFGREDVSATEGFVSAIVSHIMAGTGAALWICPVRMVFPPALQYFGIDASRIIFLEVAKEKECTWAIEEALKCPGLSAVIGEIPEVSFTASRRLQLAVEQSRSTGFLIRNHPKNLSTACVTRWQIGSLPSVAEDDLPGVGFPYWNVELLKVRNGTPGQWKLQWAAGQFRQLSKVALINRHLPGKTA